MSAPRTARARARAELTAEILDAARRQLADVGPTDLSLRAISRELGMASSALYRYFPSRDALLTALIVEAYDEIGAAVEAAESGVDRADVAGRWRAATRAARSWALDHPHQYALIYGSPVPGYEAPPDTIDPAGRVGIVLARIVQDAHASGELARPDVDAPVGLLHPGLDAVFGEVPPALVAAGIRAWTTLFGTISFEMFGHYENVVADRGAFFDLAMARAAADVGLTLSS
ncbi:TetR/AcrR family transcriptional regulator [Actinomarinicola tropica]|uniref:TetR family transcriptional regulator n=1 Tax=Actinomarinicola tropica TaxID=2789776 RepID=A0A5Q2RMY6_9ACTN|nr:TetR/AcrR family transcriptional regulator [Actinomarinicola tropica]QGG95941.1 TetR family transcriptional regulator [Actinomarinicola tropica]